MRLAEVKGLRVSQNSDTKHRKWLQIPLVLFVFAAFGALAWAYFGRYDRFSSANLRAFVGEFGGLAPLAYAIVYIVSAPVPGLASLLSPVSGLLFGALWGFLLVILVATLSSLIPFGLSRLLGREWVASKLAGKKLGRFYAQSGGQGGFLFVLMMRLIPVLPWEVQNYLAGITQVSVPVYLLATAIGIIPGSFALVLLGDSAADPMSWRFIFAIALNVVVIVGTPVTAALLRRRKRASQSEEKERQP
jgi:uncharacterized membrane protein YdjX (TVP38/TMEM64 family)